MITLRNNLTTPFKFQIFLTLFLFSRKENTVLRARVESNRVSVIPNAVDTMAFTPDPGSRSEDHGNL